MLAVAELAEYDTRAEERVHTVERALDSVRAEEELYLAHGGAASTAAKRLRDHRRLIRMRLETAIFVAPIARRYMRERGYAALERAANSIGRALRRRPPRVLGNCAEQCAGKPL